MRTLHVGLVSFLFVSGISAIVACSSPQPTTQSNDSNDTSGNDPASSNGPSSPSTPTPPPPAPAPTTPAPGVDASGIDASLPDSGVIVQQDCSATTTADACYQCCDSNNAPGYQVADDAYMACICQNPGVCAQACASTLCSAGGADPSPQCNACLGSHQASQCDQVADQACQSSPTCQAADQCAQTNSCNNKQ